MKSVVSFGKSLTVVVSLLLLAVNGVLAGAPETEEIFARARAAEAAGHRKEAKQLCMTWLEQNPQAHDVRVYLGMLHTRDRDWNEARAELDRVLAAKANHRDAQLVLIDVELGSGESHEALRKANSGLSLNPRDPEFLLRKARALKDLRFSKEALNASREAQREGADPAATRKLIGRLEPLALANKIGVDVQHEWFDAGRDPWRESSIEYQRRFRFGSLMGRVSQARRFGKNDDLYEIDAYPHLGPSTYLYLNGGWSSTSDLYPLYRWGAEIYQGLPSQWEGSLGVRRLVFESQPRDKDITLWTGSLGRYFGNHFVWARPWHSNRDDGTSFSGTVHWRRYFGHAESYFTLVAGAGSSAEEDFITQNEARLDSRVLRFEAQRWVGKGWVIKGQAGWRAQEFQVGPGTETRDSWLVGAGFERSF